MLTESLKGTRVVVTGGAGFIGSHLVDRLLQLGVSSIAVIDNVRYGSVANISLHDNRISLHTIDIGTVEPGELTSIFSGAKYVFHLAAEKLNASVDNPNRMLSTNIQWSLNVFEAARVAGVRKVAFTSSLYAYGRMAGKPYQEEETLGPATVYGVSKVAGENLAMMYSKMGLETVVLRYLFVYGPRQWGNAGYKSVIVKNFERLLHGKSPIVFGDGSQTLDYIYVSDAVEATILALMSAANGTILNVGSGEGTTILNLTKSMLATSGSDSPIQYEAPDWTHGSHRVGDISRIRHSLDWSPKISLQEGLRKTYDWLRVD